MPDQRHRPIVIQDTLICCLYLTPVTVAKTAIHPDFEGIKTICRSAAKGIIHVVKPYPHLQIKILLICKCPSMCIGCFVIFPCQHITIWIIPVFNKRLICILFAGFRIVSRNGRTGRCRRPVVRIPQVCIGIDRTNTYRIVGKANIYIAGSLSGSIIIVIPNNLDCCGCHFRLFRSARHPRQQHKQHRQHKRNAALPHLFHHIADRLHSGHAAFPDCFSIGIHPSKDGNHLCYHPLL